MLTHFRNTMAVLGLLCFANTSPAALTLRIDNVSPIPAGSVANVTVFASSPDETSSLQGFNLTMDLGGDEFGFPSPFSTVSVAPSPAPIFNDTEIVDQTEPTSTYDFAVNGSGSSMGFGTSEVGLFTLAFATNPGSTPGIYSLNFVNPTSLNPFFDDFDLVGTNTEFPTLLDGSIEITAATAVPEPSSMLALSAVAGGVYLARRRRKQQNDAA